MRNDRHFAACFALGAVRVSETPGDTQAWGRGARAEKSQQEPPFCLPLEWMGSGKGRERLQAQCPAVFAGSVAVGAEVVHSFSRL